MAYLKSAKLKILKIWLRNRSEEVLHHFAEYYAIHLLERRNTIFSIVTHPTDIRMNNGRIVTM